MGVFVMKVKFSLSIITTFLAVLFIFSTNTFAAEKSNGKLDFDFLKEQLLQDIKKEYPNATFMDLTDEEYERLQKNKDEKSIGIMGSAPPLSYLQVYAAISTNHPTYEYFGENQLSSVYDHGGAEMYIVTAELGYGYQGIAKMNTNNLSMWESLYIDLNGDSIVDGWFKWWDASGYEYGTFSYQNTSINYPNNTMYDSIYIK